MPEIESRLSGPELKKLQNFGGTVDYFLTDEQLALKAHAQIEWAGVRGTAEDKFFSMIDFIQRRHYHIVSPGIQAECKKVLGLKV